MNTQVNNEFICGDCKNKADVVVVYANSYLSFCEACLIKRLQDFKTLSKKDNMPPIIIPVKYINLGKISKYWFPQIIIRFGETDTMYGMLKDDFKKWQDKALSSVEFNIP